MYRLLKKKKKDPQPISIPNQAEEKFISTLKKKKKKMRRNIHVNPLSIMYFV